LIEAAGKRLLLPGDAELESWDQIREHCGAQLTPVDFLKVSHHGSHNGTPLNLLDELLPRNRADRAKVLVSTKRNVYGTRNPVADAPLWPNSEAAAPSWSQQMEPPAPMPIFNYD
jgi:beta-lactamase superfamily II metal-dependent hydrolase